MVHRGSGWQLRSGDAQGDRQGRRAGSSPQRDLAQRLLKEGKSVREVARSFSVHPATLYRILGTYERDFLGGSDQLSG
jgi:DNA invertase Pin-like site-specific DNA recombinase